MERLSHHAARDNCVEFSGSNFFLGFSSVYLVEIALVQIFRRKSFGRRDALRAQRLEFFPQSSMSLFFLPFF